MSKHKKEDVNKNKLLLEKIANMIVKNPDMIDVNSNITLSDAMEKLQNVINENE